MQEKSSPNLLLVDQLEMSELSHDLPAEVEDEPAVEDAAEEEVAVLLHAPL